VFDALHAHRGVSVRACTSSPTPAQSYVNSRRRTTNYLGAQDVELVRVDGQVQALVRPLAAADVTPRGRRAPRIKPLSDSTAGSLQPRRAFPIAALDHASARRS